MAAVTLKHMRIRRKAMSDAVDSAWGDANEEDAKELERALAEIDGSIRHRERNGFAMALCRCPGLQDFINRNSSMSVAELRAMLSDAAAVEIDEDAC